MGKILMYTGIGLLVIAFQAGLAYVGAMYLIKNQVMQSSAITETESLNEDLTDEKSEPAGNTKNSGNESKPNDEAGQNTDFQIQGMYTLNDFVVNPANSQGRHFFVSTMVFAFDNKNHVQKIEENEPVLIDMIINMLSKHSFEWFSNIHNREQLKNDLADAAMRILGVDRGVKVFFTKYVLQ